MEVLGIGGLLVSQRFTNRSTLYDSKLVRFRKKGNYVIYEVADHSVSDFMVSFHRLSEKQLTTVQQRLSQAIEILKENGLRASRIEEGVLEWKRHLEQSQSH